MLMAVVQEHIQLLVVMVAGVVVFMEQQVLAMVEHH
jgi:hypothetical protein